MFASDWIYGSYDAAACRYVSASDYWWEGQHYEWPNLLVSAANRRRMHPLNYLPDCVLSIVH